MKPTDPDDSGLDALIADTLEAGDAPDPELLARYADDPDSLELDQRTLAEWHESRSPIVAAQVRLMRRMPPSETASSSEDLEEATRHERVGQALLFSRVRRYGAWVAPAFAASLLWWVLPPEVNPLRLGAAVEEPLPVGADSRLTTAVRASDPVVSERVISERARAEQRPNEPAEGVESAREVTGSVESALTDNLAPTAVAPAEPVVIVEATRPLRSAKAVSSSAIEKSDRAKGQTMVEPERPSTSQLLAFRTPIYRAPADASARPHRSRTLRGARQGVELRAVVPGHVARTQLASPSVFFSIESLPPVGSELEFAVSVPESSDPLLLRSVPLPIRPGLHEIRLDSETEVLPVGVECRWSLALRAPGDGESVGEFAIGWILREPSSAEVVENLRGLSMLERPARLAEEGLWYDALAELYALRRTYPDVGPIETALTEFVEQAQP